MLRSNFRAISEWEDRRARSLTPLLPHNAQLVVTNNTDLVLIVENSTDGAREQVNMLDKLATQIGAAEALNRLLKKNSKRPYITRDDARKISQVLLEQSKKLEALSVTYRLMASALSASSENFKEVCETNDEHLKKVMHRNPFE